MADSLLKSFRDLETWRAAMKLAKGAYRISENFPRSEIYGLTSQLRRSAVSVPANIAEGYGREHRGDYLRFLSIASGSLAEVETLFELAIDLGFSEPDKEFQAQCEQVGRLLTKLRQSLKIAEDSRSERYDSAHDDQNL